jgi:hypothetical protein
MRETGAIWRFTYGHWIVAVLRIQYILLAVPRLGNRRLLTRLPFEWKPWWNHLSAHSLGTNLESFWESGQILPARLLEQANIFLFASSNEVQLVMMRLRTARTKIVAIGRIGSALGDVLH